MQSYAVGYENAREAFTHASHSPLGPRRRSARRYSVRAAGRPPRGSSVRRSGAGLGAPLFLRPRALLSRRSDRDRGDVAVHDARLELPRRLGRVFHFGLLRGARARTDALVPRAKTALHSRWDP